MGAALYVRCVDGGRAGTLRRSDMHRDRRRLRPRRGSREASGTARSCRLDLITARAGSAYGCALAFPVHVYAVGQSICGALEYVTSSNLKSGTLRRIWLDLSAQQASRSYKLI
jgi:hypothetical protein